jgi:hypothetical protein
MLHSPCSWNLDPEGEIRVRVLNSISPWFGITYQADKPTVMERIRDLIRQGEYPARLWA